MMDLRLMFGVLGLCYIRLLVVLFHLMVKILRYSILFICDFFNISF